MELALLHVAVLVGAILVSAPDARACPTGWFGENCTYMCHCETINTCNVNGECDGGNPCARAFFGPSCQYADVALNRGVNSMPPDFNKEVTPCRKKTSQLSVSLTFPTDQPLFWFRITTVNSEFPHNFSVRINDYDTCKNERHFRVSATELDVTCDTHAKLVKLELRGPIAQSVCSIHVAGGRNVALKQATSQSTTHSSNTVDAYQPHLAVDGDNGSCSRTADDPAGSSWQIMFNRPQLLYAVVIIRIRSQFEHDVHGFVLETFNEQNHVTETYTVPDFLGPVYHILLKERTPVRSLKIFRLPRAEGAKYLLLCEVQVYGETLCPDGTYGLYCNKSCTCKREDICNLATGACAPGCPAGKYGFGCSLDCNNNCYLGKCHYRFGKCFQCTPGYWGENCEKACADGTYGLGCRGECSLNCRANCAHETGICDCLGNYLEPFCNECKSGFYGENCTQPCPRTCENSLCNRSTGYCTKCQGAHIGLYCDECMSSNYGTLCYSRCSTYCVNETCDPHNGTCPACMDGYSGPKCVIEPPENATLQSLLITLFFAAILVLFLAILLLRKRQSGLYGESEEEETAESSLSSSASPNRLNVSW